MGLRFKNEAAYAEYLRKHPEMQAKLPESEAPPVRRSKPEYDIEKLVAYTPMASPGFTTVRVERSNALQTFIRVGAIITGILWGLSALFWAAAWCMQTWRDIHGCA